MSKNCAKCENISTQIYVECDKIYQSKDCVQEFWYLGVALIFNLSNLRMTILHSEQLLVAKHVKSYAVFFCILTLTHVFVVKVSHSKSCG